jgi:hypothetical protein
MEQSEQQEKRREWAKRITVEAFQECGVKLSEDDPVILVAAVFRRALEEWDIERQVFSRAVIDDVAEKLDAFEKGLTEVVNDVLERVWSRIQIQLNQVQEEIGKAVETAESAAKTGSDKVIVSVPTSLPQTMQIEDRSDRRRLEGIAIGVGLVLLGMLIKMFLF